MSAVCAGAGGQQPSAEELEGNSDRPPCHSGHLLADRHLRHLVDTRYTAQGGGGGPAWRETPVGRRGSVTTPCATLTQTHTHFPVLWPLSCRDMPIRSAINLSSGAELTVFVSKSACGRRGLARRHVTASFHMAALRCRDGHV